MVDAVCSPVAICVLGMARSGTSLTTRVLQRAGVYLGPEEELLQSDLRQLAGEGEEVLARARETNPRGFWEHYRIMRLNERLLRAFGGNWREPPLLPDGWEASERLAGEREEAGVLLDQSFSGHSLWGWKDPRNSLTLRFWQKRVPRMRYVVCLRNPVDVAASLRRRDGIPFERAVELWHVYTDAALHVTAGAARIVVPYESHFADPHGTAEWLAAFAGRPGAFRGASGGRAVEEMIDPGLWRHRTSPGDVLGNGVPAATARLYLSASRSSASSFS